MNFEVYAYWNIEELTATFNAVAALPRPGRVIRFPRTGFRPRSWGRFPTGRS